MNWMKRILLSILAGLIFISLMVVDVQFRYVRKLFESAEDAPQKPIAIVLGASVTSSGEPSDALRDRLLVAQTLYERDRVEKILLSGDDGKYHVDEISVMREFLESRGVPKSDLLEDGRGYRTYESCKRAVQEFGITQAVLITQRFHIGRALYLCNRLGMDAIGVPSDLSSYRRVIFFTLRDLAASVEAWIDINIRPPKPPVE